MGRVIDLTNRVFESYTIISFEGLDKNGHAEWKGQCSCGDTRVLRGARFRSGVRCPVCSPPPSRGRRGPSGLSAEEVTWNSILAVIRNNAKSRGLEMGLSKAEMLKLMRLDCFYCGAPPGNHRRTRGNTTVLWQGIDRLDNSKGYVAENVVPCCKRCNVTKNDQSLEEFLQHIKAIHRHLRLDNV